MSDERLSYDNLEKKYKTLVTWYDKYNGTPCEQIRHIQEVEVLESRIAKLQQALAAMLNEWAKATRYGSPIALAANTNVAFARDIFNSELKTNIDNKQQQFRKQNNNE